MHGGVALDDLDTENVDAVRKGCENLMRHLHNVKSYGVPAVVAANRFTSDTDAEMAALEEAVGATGAESIACTHWTDGGAGAEDLARHVVKLCSGTRSQFAPLYDDTLSLWEKTSTIATRIYGADEIIADKKVRDQFRRYEREGYGHFPICMAKTQYSFSTDPQLKGAPRRHSVPIREVRLPAGAEFLVVICGDIMTMPGLPRVPAANSIDIDAEGQIEGLF
jgi:formate--tetrahydrofolate ligase